MSETSATLKPDGGFRLTSMLWVVGLAVVGAIAFAVLSVYAPDLRTANDGQAHALSRSAVGFAGIVRLLNESGVPTVVSRSAPLSGQDSSLLVLTPPGPVSEGQMNTLLKRTGPVLIVPQKWPTEPDPRHPGWVTTDSDLGAAKGQLVLNRPQSFTVKRSDAKFQPTLSPPAQPGFFGAGTVLPFGTIRWMQTVTPGEGRVELQDQSGRPVLVAAAQGRVYVLSDPDLLNNQGIADIRTAAGTVALIKALCGPNGSVVFDVTLNGFERARSPWRVALEPPFLAATLCCLAAAFLLGWRSVARFGPIERYGRAVALGKRALVDNAAGLIRLTRREPRMAGRYAALIRRSIATTVGAPRDLGPDALDAYLDRLGDPSGETKPFTALAAAAAKSETEPELLRTAAALYTYQMELTRGRS